MKKLKSISIKNFKAIRDSKTLKITPLTAFIGNNGSGKSSIVEALQMLKSFALDGIDSALAPWYGFDYIWNKAVKHEVDKKSESDILTNSMSFVLNFKGEQKLRLELEISKNGEKIVFNKFTINKEEQGNINKDRLPETELNDIVKNWQFLTLNPFSMFNPSIQKRSLGEIQLKPNGGNIAEYLQSIRDLDKDAFDGIIEAMKYVLPYADDLKPQITSELEQKIYLSMSEKNIEEEMPSWLLSTGTLRILAILAVLRHPQPSSLVIIEEIENGLDPRTIHLVIEEMRSFVESGKGQIIVTTHSPFLLDLLTISQIIVVDRDKNGKPVFIRPEKDKDLSDWIDGFSPGKLYTMGTFTGDKL